MNELVEQYEMAIDVYKIFELDNKTRIAAIEALKYAIEEIKKWRVHHE